MSKILIDCDSLKKNFKPVLDISINDIEGAINLADNLDIPSGFSYRSYLKSISRELNNKKDNCNEIKEFVDNSITNTESSINSISDLFNKI